MAAAERRTVGRPLLPRDPGARAHSRPWSKAAGPTPDGTAGELSETKWWLLDALTRFAEPYQERRIRAAVAAAVAGAGLPLLLHDVRVGQ